MPNATRQSYLPSPGILILEGIRYHGAQNSGVFEGCEQAASVVATVECNDGEFSFGDLVVMGVDGVAESGGTAAGG